MLRVSRCPILVFLFAILALSRVDAASVTLAWDASPEADIVGYRIYYSTISGSYGTAVQAEDSLSTQIPNLQPGTTYYFVVTAYDAADLESLPSTELAYTVPSDPLNDNDQDGLPDQWESTHGLSTSPDGTIGDGRDGDPDGDGISNLLEYLLDTDPQVADASPLKAPQLVQDATDGKWYMTISVRRRTNDVRIAYRVERSTDLSIWSNAQTEVAAPPVSNPGGESETLTYRILPAVEDNGATFVRVNAALNPAN